MGDNVYKVLMGENAPFLGLSNEKYTEYLRRGIIIATHYDIAQNNIQNTYTYNTVDITWVDSQPFTSLNVPISYPFISNDGWGIQVKPEIGDTVIAAFLPNSQPQILRFIKRSEFLQLGQTNINDGTQIVNEYGDPIKMDGQGAYNPFREIVPGEVSIKSKKEAEMYIDRNGAFKIITRTQDQEKNNERNQEISYGVSVVNESTGEIKTDFKGNNINYEHKDNQSGYSKTIGSDGSFTIKNNGWEIVCDNDKKLTIKNTTGDILTVDNGVINFKNNKGDSIEISGGKIKVGTSAHEPAVLGDTLTSFMETIIGVYNGHTHLYSPGGGKPTDTAAPTSLMEIEDFLSKKVVVE